MAIRFGTWDSNISLFFAFFVNAAILIVAGAAFHYGPQANVGVAYISDAYHLIAPAVRSAHHLIGFPHNSANCLTGSPITARYFDLIGHPPHGARWAALGARHRGAHTRRGCPHFQLGLSLA